MALTLNGKSREDIGRRDFIALGLAVGVRPRAVESALNELGERAGGRSRRRPMHTSRRGVQALRQRRMHMDHPSDIRRPGSEV